MTDFHKQILECDLSNLCQIHDLLCSLQAQQYNTPLSNNFLVRILKTVSDPTINEKVIEIMTDFCGRQAKGECTQNFEFHDFKLQLKEGNYEDCDLGFQTWHSSLLLSQLIDDQTVSVSNCNVLELGCGTGLVGMVCSKNGAKFTLCTDYHSQVLKGVKENIIANNLENIDVAVLDWRYVDDAQMHGSGHNADDLEFKPIAMNWDVVVAADCIYSLEHARLVPIVASEYLKRGGKFYVLIPHRQQFKKEYLEFENNMRVNVKWTLESTLKLEHENIEYCYYDFTLN